MKNHCKANPCCANPTNCEVPIPQHASGMPWLNPKVEPEVPAFEMELQEYHAPPTFEELFKMGLDRELPELLAPKDGPSIGLGESGSKRHGHMSLGLPDWEFPRDNIPAKDGSVAIIHAYHFMEHLTGEQAIMMLAEIERVLMTGGIFQFCIPWAKAEIAFQDLTHKSFWTESSFRMLMQNKYYDPANRGQPWKLRQHYLVVAGIVERNMCLLGQLVKD